MTPDEEVSILGGQALVAYHGDDPTVLLRAGRYEGWTVRYGGVRFDEVGEELVLRYDIQLTSPEDDPGAEPGSDFEEYFGELLSFLMLLVAGAVVGSDWEQYRLE